MGVAPVSRAHETPAASSRGPDLTAYCCARTPVGAITHACMPESAAAASAKAGDRGLSLSPHPRGAGDSSRGRRAPCPPGSRGRRSPAPPRARREAPRARPDVRARRVPHGRDAQQVDVVAQAKRELQVQQLVIGEPLASECDLRHEAGELHGADGAREAHELAARPQRRGNGGRRRSPPPRARSRRGGASTPGTRHRAPGGRAGSCPTRRRPRAARNGGRPSV